MAQALGKSKGRMCRNSAAPRLRWSGSDKHVERRKHRISDHSHDVGRNTTMTIASTALTRPGNASILQEMRQSCTRSSKVRMRALPDSHLQDEPDSRSANW